MSIACLAELPSKLAFCQQRLAQAEKLNKLGSKEGAKMKDEAEKLMADTLKVADDLLRTSTQVHWQPKHLLGTADKQCSTTCCTLVVTQNAWHLCRSSLT